MTTAGANISASPKRPVAKAKLVMFLAILALLAGGGAMAFQLFSDKTLSFSVLLDGKELPVGTAPKVRVDGLPFTSGCTVKMGSHKLTAELQNAEPFERQFRVLWGDQNLGVLSFESSKGSALVSVTPSPATVTMKRGREVLADGVAPLTIENLPFGEYEVEIRRGEYRETRRVAIRDKKPTEVQVALNLGSVRLSADPPDAEFKLTGNGRQWEGKLPAQVDDIPAGLYRLSTRRKDWELESGVSVVRGDITTNKTEFLYGSIRVTSHPDEMSAEIAGVVTGKTPLIVRELRPGQYALTASDGENQVAADIVVAPAAETNFHIALHYCAAQLASEPPGATVSRHGRGVGKTPLMLDRIMAGEHPFEFSLPGYLPTTIVLRVMEGATTSVVAKLLSERYVEAIAQAKAALQENDFAKARDLAESATRIAPSEPGGRDIEAQIQEGRARFEAAQAAARRKAAVDVIERAIDAAGGRERLARYKMCRTVCTSPGKMPDGTDYTLRAVIVHELPSNIWQESEIRYQPKTIISSLAKYGVQVRVNGQVPDPNRVIRSTMCVAGDSAWYLLNGNLSPLPSNLEQKLRGELCRHEWTRLYPLLSKDVQLDQLSLSPSPIPGTVAISARKQGVPDHVLFFDSSTWLLKGLQYEDLDDSGLQKVRVTLRFTGHRSFSGLVSPTHAVMEHNGTLVRSVEIESIEFSEHATPSIFRAPAGSGNGLRRTAQ